MQACQVTVACGSEDEAQRVATALLDRRLAACVQVVGPVESRYWWQGRQEAAAEWLALAKSDAGLLDRLVEAVTAVHSYDVPEVVAVPVLGGNPAYLAWLADELAT